MSSRHAKVGLQMLLERRQREELSRYYNECDKAEQRIRQRADFETRNFSRFQAGELKRRAKQRAQQAEAQLNDRRNRLSSLLRSEEQQYTREITAQIESPEQRRFRIMDSLKHLKDMRQQEHDDFVKMKNDQAWRDNCDPLRAKISQALEKAVIKERDQQVIERDMRRMEEDAEEAKYVETVKQNAKEFREMQEQEREDRRMKINRNRETWLAEMAAHREKEAQRKHQEYLESLEFRTTTEQAIQMAKEEAERKAALQAARRKELDELNNEQTTRKKMLVDQDKAIDAEYARKAAEELRQEQEDQLVERIVRMRKAAQNAQLYSTQMGRVQANNDETEAYLQAAQDEMNRREDEMREKDYQARRKLLMDAVADRVQTIKLHEQQRENRKYEKELERIELEKDIAMKKQLDQEEYEQRRRAIDNQYQMLASQTRLKREREAKERQDEKDSVAAMIKGWQDEERRIQEELAKPNTFLVGGRFRGHR